MDTLELRVLRRQTDAFIKENPTQVAVSRRAKVSDGAGGSTYTYGAPMAAQTGRLIPAGQGQAQVQTRTVDGETIDPSFVLIAAHDADIKQGDRFKRDGRDHEIVYVRPDRRYETWAEVAYRG